MTGDLLKAELRPGAMYCSNGAAAFMAPLMEEYQTNYPDIALFLRGDSGFATDELYSLCETNGTSYAIRLKENAVLKRLAKKLESEPEDMTRDNIVPYAVVYGEFLYKAGSWDYPRRVVCKLEKPYGQMLHLYTFIVTNMDSSPEDIVRFYSKRGNMENFIKECKSGFDMAYVSSSSQIVNANRMQIHALAYNLFNWFRRLTLPEELKRDRVDTLRLKLLKIAANATSTSSCAAVVRSRRSFAKHSAIFGILRRCWNSRLHVHLDSRITSLAIQGGSAPFNGGILPIRGLAASLF